MYQLYMYTPQLSHHSISLVEGIADLDWKITADVIIRWALFVFAVWLIDRHELGTLGGYNILIFGNWLFRGHL